MRPRTASLASPTMGPPPRMGWRVRLLRTEAGRNSLVMIGSGGTLALLQALQFLLVARALGAHEFGRVASVTAIVAALVPFSSLGLGNIGVMRIARGQAAPQRCLGNALLVTTGSGAAAVLAAIAIAVLFLNDPQAWLLALLLGVSEILLTKYVDVTAQIYMGLEKHAFSAVFYNLHLLLRVLFAGSLLFVFPQPTAADWVVMHVVSGVVSATLVLLVSVPRLGRPTAVLGEAIRDAKQGVFFSIQLAARGVQTDADKGFLARDISPGAAGVYTAAYRLAHMACIPVFAIQVALLARIFRDGHHSGLAGTLSGLRIQILGGAAYGALLAGLLYIIAPLLPWVLGPSFANSTGILQALCLLPLFLIMQSMYSQVLSATKVLHWVGLIQMAAAGLTVVLNAVLVPKYGWTGAMAAAYISQTCLLVGLLLLTRMQLRRERARGS